MSWLDERTCPVCGADGFDPDCDEVDIGVGVQEFGFRGLCRRCDEVSQCECGKWIARESVSHDCKALTGSG